MPSAIRVSEELVCVVGCHVVKGQTVKPGTPIIDVMARDGIVQTLFSSAFGVIEHVEGHRVFPETANDACFEQSGFMFLGGGSGTVFKKDEVLCHISGGDGNDFGTIRGLTPRPTTVMSRRYARLMYGPT